jgi:hypothetical protein
MSNLLDEDDVVDYTKLHSEISGSQAIAAGAISSQRLGSTDVWPFLEPFQQVVHPRANRLGKSLKVFSGCCGEPDHRSIMTSYDKKVKSWRRYYAKVGGT